MDQRYDWRIGRRAGGSGRPRRSPCRTVAGLGATLLLIGVLVAAVAAPAAAQQHCAPPGTTITPAPWAQHYFSPDRVWALATGAGQRVAVVSTGVADAPMLADAVVAREDFAPAESAGEPSGMVDCDGTGTGAAGLIAAAPTTGVGFHGLAPDTLILDAKVVGDRFSAAGQDRPVAPGAMARGIEWAVEEGATVVVVPTATYRQTAALRAAVARAIEADIVLVAAVDEIAQSSETDGPSDDPQPEFSAPAEEVGVEDGEATPIPYPAGFDGVIGVGAIGADGQAHSPRSRHVDLVAPGVDLVTTYPLGGLGSATGTGFAAAYVAGSVALLRSYRPELSAAEVADRLFATASPAPEGVGSTSYGYGVVNPYLAMADGLADGRPVAVAPHQPAVVSEQERLHRSAREASDALAVRLAVGGVVVMLVAVTLVELTRRARRRGWRTGRAAEFAERPGAEAPGPPRELFDSSLRRTG